jgi:hypothetical protein
MVSADVAEENVKINLDARPTLLTAIRPLPHLHTKLLELIFTRGPKFNILNSTKLRINNNFNENKFEEWPRSRD